MHEGYDEQSRIRLTESIATLEKQIGYTFNDKGLAAQALTHSSYANESQAVLSNERLEFLGDAVLELCISDYLYSRFSSCSEGDLTKLRATVVCEGNLAKAAKVINLGEHLIFGVGASQTAGSRERSSTLCDAFEAVIGAIYLDSGSEHANKFIMKFATPLADLSDATFSPNDFKGQLQDKLQKQGNPQIQYKILKESGPDHDKEFTAQVTEGSRVLAKGKGKSKKEAEQNAAQNALRVLGDL